MSSSTAPDVRSDDRADMPRPSRPRDSIANMGAPEALLGVQPIVFTATKSQVRRRLLAAGRPGYGSLPLVLRTPFRSRLSSGRKALLQQLAFVCLEPARHQRGQITIKKPMRRERSNSLEQLAKLSVGSEANAVVIGGQVPRHTGLARPFSSLTIARRATFAPETSLHAAPSLRNARASGLHCRSLAASDEAFAPSRSVLSTSEVTCCDGHEKFGEHHGCSGPDDPAATSRGTAV
jgi:hypothetical protein